MVSFRVPDDSTTVRVPLKVVAEAGVNLTTNEHCAEGDRTNPAKQVELAESSDKLVPVMACDDSVTLILLAFVTVKAWETEAPTSVLENTNGDGVRVGAPTTNPVPVSEAETVPWSVTTLAEPVNVDPPVGVKVAVSVQVSFGAITSPTVQVVEPSEKPVPVTARDETVALTFFPFRIVKVVDELSPTFKLG
jgi:hypothetical protein